MVQNKAMNSFVNMNSLQSFLLYKSEHSIKNDYKKRNINL
jgi:hypothetical protein